VKVADSLSSYDNLRMQTFAFLASQDLGDPQATAEAVLKIVDSDDPPLRFVVGATVLPIVRAAYAERLAAWDAWEAISNAAQGKAKKGPAA
jgi:hypothetical protein